MNRYEILESIVITVGLIIFLTWLKLANSTSIELMLLALIIFILFAILVSRFFKYNAKKQNIERNEKWYVSLFILFFVILYTGLLNKFILGYSFLHDSSWLLPGFIGASIGSYFRKKRSR